MRITITMFGERAGGENPHHREPRGGYHGVKGDGGLAALHRTYHKPFYVCVCVCIYIYICVTCMSCLHVPFIYIYTHIHAHACICMYMYLYMHMHMYMYMYTHMYIYMHTYPAAWFFVGDFLVKLCFRYSFKQILKLFWVGKKCYVLCES